MKIKNNRLPLGIRNNNPLNIRFNAGNKWVGATGVDSGFVVFESQYCGLRAAFVLLYRYIEVYNLKSVSEVITRWAPPKENDTKNYIKFVTSQMSDFDGMKLDFKNCSMMLTLLFAMIHVESGKVGVFSINSDVMADAYLAVFKKHYPKKAYLEIIKEVNASIVDYDDDEEK